MRTLVSGLTTIDLIQTVDHAPSSNEKVTSTSALLDVGGPAANAARTAAALSASPILASPIGPGLFGDLAARWLRQAGVDIVDLASQGDPPISAIAIDAVGNRSVVSSNASGRPHGFPPASIFDDVTALLVDGHVLDVQIALARTARGLGLPVVLDGGSYKRGIEALLPHVTHGIFSADYRMPSGEPIQALAKAGMMFVARTDGGRPITAYIGGQAHEVEVPHADVVDTLGAGDVLHGAFLAELAGGRSELDALRAAAEVASSSVAFAGAMGWAEARQAGGQ
ncbi:MAG: PfkB family carbohydrate kinase [Actinomycetaceae bacterium]|nr:PfkB family carbohydrate kinase [Actinomycetaceae bacterium]